MCVCVAADDSIHWVSESPQEQLDSIVLGVCKAIIDDSKNVLTRASALYL